MSYRPDIDGLRAIAVLSVLFYHVGLGAPGGYVGVDVFFVISGYLITGMLLKSMRENSFSYLDFWERRIRRLIPALAVLTSFTAVLGYFVLLPGDLTDLGGALIAQPLLASNVYFWRAIKDGYFGDAPEIRPLLHTWSLGVEEQFYVFYPLFLLFCHKSRLKRHLGNTILVTGLLSLLLCVGLTPIKSVAAFFNLPTRAWELLLGGLLHFLPHHHANIRIRQLSAWLGLSLIGYPTFYFNEVTSFPGYAALLPCLGASLLIWASGFPSWMSAPGLVFIGKLSYSIYLWHWPLVAYSAYLGLMESFEAKILILLLSLLLGYLSWRWVEGPVREKKIFASRSALWVLFTIYVALSIGMGAKFRLEKGFPEHWSSYALGYLDSFHDARELQDKLDITTSNSKPVEIGTKYDDVTPTFILWGDSHARALYPALDSAATKLKVKGLLVTRSGTPALLRSEALDLPTKSKFRWEKELVLATVQRCQDPIVFMASKWNKDALPLSDLELTVKALQDAGADVVFVADVPKLPFDAPRYSALRDRYPKLPILTGEIAAQHLVTSMSIQRIVETLSRIDKSRFQVIDLGPQGISWNAVVEDREVLYSDRHHLSEAGALRLQGIFEDALRNTRASRI